MQTLLFKRPTFNQLAKTISIAVLATITSTAIADNSYVYISSHDGARDKKKAFPTACKVQISYLDGDNGSTDSCTFTGSGSKSGGQGCQLNNWSHINDNDSRLTIGIIDGGSGKSIQDCYEAGGIRIGSIYDQKNKMPTIWDWTKGANSAGNNCVNNFFEKENSNWEYAHLGGSKNKINNGNAMTSFTTGTKGGGSKRVKSCTTTSVVTDL